MPLERVVIGKVIEQRLDEALQQLIAPLGGISRIVAAGSRVLIKPNLVFAPTSRGITHPELIEAVVRLVKEANPREILIAEGAADTYTTQGFRFQGLYRIAARYGAKLVDLNLEEGVRTPVPAGLGREYILLPRAVVESDVFVSLPVFKLWGNSPLSLSLKNLIGLYGGRYYGYNKDSHLRGRELSYYGLPGEVGTELGAHKPTVAESICALNSVVRTDLAIVDALEGGDGAGNWIRLDTLIAGRNPVAVDTVGLAMAGLKASDYAITRLCAARGLGPCQLDEIEVLGERIADVAFPLHRLRENVLELPARFCLGLLDAGALWQMHRAFTLYGLLPAEASAPATREGLLEVVRGVVESEGFYTAALKGCSECALHLLDLIIAQGGTSGSMAAVEAEFTRRWGDVGQYYMPSARTLTRLGLAYAVDSAYRHYYLLPEGVVAARRGM